MFVKYPFIDEQHRLALEAAIRNHNFLSEPLAAKLYRHALEATTGRLGTENGFFYSHIETNDFILGVCTDARYGFFIQLVRRKNDPHLLLTLGQKFAMEQVDSMRGNINTVFW